MSGLDAQFNIISYAVISSKYENKQNISHSFIPLLEHVLLSIEKDYIPIKQIYDLFQEIYGYKIPPAVMDYLLRILKSQGKIEFIKGENIEIIKECIQDYEDKYLLETSLKSLATNLDVYFKKQGISIDKTKIVNDLLRFIVKNAIEFNSFLNYNSDLEFDKSEEDDDFDNIVVSFLLEERRNDTKDYKFIKDIYFGVIIASLISSGNDTVDNKEKFAVENVILDSNYIFRLLNLQTELEYLAAQDTHKSLIEKGCSFCVARETLKQIADTIHNAIDSCSTSANSVLRIVGEERFAGLASACLRRDLSSAKLEEIISKLEKTLSEHYSVVILNDTEFDSIEIEQDDAFRSLCSDKPHSSTAGIIHDLKLIQYVRNKRSSTVYCMQQAKWWVLTDDYKLTKWNAKSTGKGKVLECITESQLATVMWLNEPHVLSHDSLFSTALALRNRTLIGNIEFERISRAIETQKEKYASDPAVIDKLALVFSQRLITIEDLAKEDTDKHDEIFAQSIEKAKEFSLAQAKLANENKALREEVENNKKDYALGSELATIAIEEQKSLLTAETLAHIETLQKLLEEKQSKCDGYTAQKTISQKKYKLQCLITKFIVGLILCAIAFIASMIIQKSFGDWYLDNQLFYILISSAVSLILLSVLGISWQALCTKWISAVAAFIVKVLSRLHVLKNHLEIISNIDDCLLELNTEIEGILDQIDKKSNI